LKATEPTQTAAREAWRHFWRIFMEDKRRRWAILSEMGLSPQQSMALSTLEPGEPMTMSALADALHCDNSNVTGIVDRLEAEGLAVRLPVENDRRAMLVRLTPRGAADFALLAAEHETWVNELLAAVTHWDAEHLADQLKAVRDSLAQQERTQ
jgi:DNA-binding MarR family transcriptional regulator